MATINKVIDSKQIYFNFNIDTNKIKRQVCFNQLKNKLIWCNNLSYLDYLKLLKEYEFCICPEGNGVDTHRLWECLYLKVVPIVIKSEFTNILIKKCHLKNKYKQLKRNQQLKINQQLRKIQQLELVKIKK